MGLQCSVLGHDYGETEVERERSERGREVVRTARRVERCRNCGHVRTVSANTEITTLEAAAGVVRDSDGTVLAATDGDAAGVVSETAGTDATGPQRTMGDPSHGSGVDSRLANGVGDGMGEADAIDEIPVVDERRTEDTVSGREPGEWPADPRTEPTDDEAVAGADADASASFSAVGGSVDDSSGEGAAASGEWNAHGDGAAHGGASTQRTDGNGLVETNVRPLGKTFGCPACGFTAAVIDSPLRAGDSCPECRRGYLAWETRKG